MNDPNSTAANSIETATVGGGCFWCLEAVFQQLDGVLSVESGYAGGEVLNPTYRQVCSGTTGHAEVCQIRFDSRRITFSELLNVFWKIHNPTTLNRQGNDVGTQYRSVIYYHTSLQREEALASRVSAEASGLWTDPIVTEITELPVYYPAEDYHQNYFQDNQREAYCVYVIRPKLEHLRTDFPDILKPADKK